MKMGCKLALKLQSFNDGWLEKIKMSYFFESLRVICKVAILQKSQIQQEIFAHPYLYTLLIVGGSELSLEISSDIQFFLHESLEYTYIDHN